MRTILCFGDSNTHGTCAMRHSMDRRRFPASQRWPNIMAGILGADVEVIAEGHPGRTAVLDDPVEGAHKNAMRSLHAILETHRPIDLVIVVLGTNDLKARFNISAHDVALGIQRLVSEIRRSDSGVEGAAPKVLIASPATAMETGIFVETFAGAHEKSRALPSKLKTVAEAQGVSLIDLAQYASVDPVDGIHLDAAAHDNIGKAMADAVRREFDT